MTYYNIPKILEIIRMYHINKQNIRENTRQIRSVGVGQYGIEATMPRGNTTNDSTATEGIRLYENNKYFKQVQTDMKYIEDRWDRVTDEKEAQVLALRLIGNSETDIAYILGLHRSSVYRILDSVARTIKGYPQDSATNETNFI